MAADEGRFGRIGDVRRAWSPPGVRPLVAKQIVRESVYAYAGVVPTLGQMTTLVLPYANTEMMNLFLEQVSQEFADYFASVPGGILRAGQLAILMQVDRAGWHRSDSLVVPENILLLLQPPYSPELNPTEHIWEEIREKHFYNQVFESIDGVMDRLCQGLRGLMMVPEQLRSMTHFPHPRITR